MDLEHMDFLVELQINNNNLFQKQNKYLIPVVCCAAGWHWIAPQTHWTTLMTIPQIPVAQNVHWYCFGVIIGPSFRASANVRAIEILLRAFGSASYIFSILFA